MHVKKKPHISSAASAVTATPKPAAASVVTATPKPAAASVVTATPKPAAALPGFYFDIERNRYFRIGTEPSQRPPSPKPVRPSPCTKPPLSLLNCLRRREIDQWLPRQLLADATVRLYNHCSFIDNVAADMALSVRYNKILCSGGSVMSICTLFENWESNASKVRKENIHDHCKALEWNPKREWFGAVKGSVDLETTRLEIQNATNGKILRCCFSGSDISCFSWKKCGKKLAAAVSNNVFVVHSLDSLQTKKHHSRDHIVSLCWSTDEEEESCFFGGARNGSCIRYDQRSKRLEHLFSQKVFISSLTTVKDDFHLLAGSLDGTIKLWDLRYAAKGPLISFRETIRGGGSRNVVDVDSSCTVVAAVDEKGKSVAVWSATTGKLIHQIDLTRISAVGEPKRVSRGEAPLSLFVGSTLGVVAVHAREK